MVVLFVSWDFREGIAADTMAAAISRFEGGPVFAVAVETGTDDYTLALSDAKLDAAEARRRWQADCDADVPLS